MSGQETTEVRKGHEFSIPLLESYLVKNISNFYGPIQVKQFNVGQSNPTFLVIDGRGRKVVVRKKPTGKLIATAHMIEREFKILKALKTIDFPVPEVYTFCQSDDVLGTPFYVMEFLVGRIFVDPTLPDLSPQERNACYLSAVETLARLHQINYESIGLIDYGKSGGFYTRQISRMSTTSRAQEIPDVIPPLPHLEELLKWFTKNLPPDSSTIVHGDYKFDNLIFHPSESRVIGVLDWEMSTIGHPLSDLANLCLGFHFPEDFPAPIINITQLEPSYGVPSEEQVLRAYCNILKKPYPIQGWKFCVSFALFRMGTILQGVASRAAKGQASNPAAEIIGQIAGPLAEQAWELIENKSKL